MLVHITQEGRCEVSMLVVIAAKLIVEAANKCRQILG